MNFARNIVFSTIQNDQLGFDMPVLHQKKLIQSIAYDSISCPVLKPSDALISVISYNFMHLWYIVHAIIILLEIKETHSL